MKIPDGTPTKAAYFVKLDEDVWNGYAPEFQEECKDYWKLEGEELDVEECVLKLVPDPLLAVSRKEVPYIAWRHRYSDYIRKKMEIDDFVIPIRVRDKFLSIPMLEEINEMLKEYPNGTRWQAYVVKDGKMEFIREGRVK